MANSQTSARVYSGDSEHVSGAFVEIVDSDNLLIIYVKCSILDVWLGSKYAFVKRMP